MKRLEKEKRIFIEVDWMVRSDFMTHISGENHLEWNFFVFLKLNAIWRRLRKNINFNIKAGACHLKIRFLPFKIMLDSSDALRFGYILPMVFMIFFSFFFVITFHDFFRNKFFFFPFNKIKIFCHFTKIFSYPCVKYVLKINIFQKSKLVKFFS